VPIRRRDTRDRLTFELVESPGEDVDDEASWAPVTAVPSAPRAARPATEDGAAPDGDQGDVHDAGSTTLGDQDREAAGRRRRRRTAVVATVSVGVVLVLGGMLAVDAWHARGDLDRLRNAPGGIEPIPDAPRELWTVETGILSGISVVRGGVVTVEDGEAVARDLGSGEVRWRADVGTHGTCGAPALWTLPSGEPEGTLVCLTPRYDDPGDDSTTRIDPLTGERLDAVGWDLVVLADDGEVLGRRDLTPDGGRPSVGPGGTVLRVERVGELPEGDGEPVEQDPATGKVVGLPAGRDVVVTSEDALTGEERWRYELEFAPGASGSCIAWSGENGEETRADLENLWALADGGFARVEGCGISAWFDASGTRLDVPENPNDGIVRLADGSLYRDPESGGMDWGNAIGTDAPFRPAVLDAQGAVRWTPPGSLYLPEATDGSAPDLLLGRDGFELVAWDTAGTERWRTEVVGLPVTVGAVAGGVVVVPGTSGTLEGLDAATGRRVWTLEAADLALPGPGGVPRTSSPEQFFTDGERVVVTLSDWDAGTSSLVAVDLADGTVAWREEPTPDGGTSWAVPLRGALLRMSETAVTRVG